MSSPGRQRYLLGAVACVSVLLAGALWLFAPTKLPSKPYALSSMELPDLSAPTTRSIRFGGPLERPMVINFFFSDCVGCVTELPRIQAAADKWAGRIDIVGVDHFEPLANATAFVKTANVTFPVAWDQTGDLAPVAGVNAFPATLFVDRDGIVRRRVLGQISEQTLNSELQKLFMSSDVN